MPVTAPSPAQVCFGRFELDLTSGELHTDGRKIPLPPKSFEILRALAEHPGEVVTRDELRSKVWSTNTYVEFDDGLNHAVQKLRQVLGDSAEHPQFIETLPRHGYRLIALVDTGHEQKPLKERPRRLFVIAVGFLTVAVALIVLNVGGWRSRVLGGRGEAPIRSLAVLPLSNLSGDPQQDYFADGMTDALITDLAKLRDVKVISRTSVMQFKDVKKPLPEVARALGVDGILEGSVQRSGARVRITVQLIRGPNDTHLWAESYERDAHDVLTLQGEIAQAVAREIKVALTPEESTHLTRARPVKPEAYELYLKGQYHYYKWNPEDFKKAVDYFRKAIDADPHWAPPYAALANTYGWLWIDGAIPPQEALPQFSAALKTALEIDPTLPEVHYTQAAAAFYYRWNWDEADREFRRALELDPSLVEARFEYAWFLSTMGRLPEAIAEAQRAVERDPLSVSANLALGSVYSVARQDEKAIAQLQRTEAIEPNDSRAYEFLCGVYEQKGLFEDAIREYGKAMKLWGARPDQLAGLELAYKQSGANGYWKWKLSEAKRQRAPYEIAIVYAQLGDAGQSAAWLEKAYEGHAWQMVQLKTFPMWDPVRSDTRFQELLRRLNFP
ncbi:MAG: winged helix-turn-helix domain-containing protein [Acidobacteriia bacterium]|nr:winged helix-turn-helix domain-containing protein [Terriglobia bacterium]